MKNSRKLTPREIKWSMLMIQEFLEENFEEDWLLGLMMMKAYVCNAEDLYGIEIGRIKGIKPDELHQVETKDEEYLQ